MLPCPNQVPQRFVAAPCTLVLLFVIDTLFADLLRHVLLAFSPQIAQCRLRVWVRHARVRLGEAEGFHLVHQAFPGSLVLSAHRHCVLRSTSRIIASLLAQSLVDRAEGLSLEENALAFLTDELPAINGERPA